MAGLGEGGEQNQQRDGSLLLSFHGTAQHSIQLTEAQQAALIPLLRGDGR